MVVPELATKAASGHCVALRPPPRPLALCRLTHLMTHLLRWCQDSNLVEWWKEPPPTQGWKWRSQIERTDQEASLKSLHLNCQWRIQAEIFSRSLENRALAINFKPDWRTYGTRRHGHGSGWPGEKSTGLLACGCQATQRLLPGQVF